MNGSMFLWHIKIDKQKFIYIKIHDDYNSIKYLLLFYLHNF